MPAQPCLAAGAPPDASASPSVPRIATDSRPVLDSKAALPKREIEPQSAAQRRISIKLSQGLPHEFNFKACLAPNSGALPTAQARRLSAGLRCRPQTPFRCDELVSGAAAANSATIN